MKITSETNKGKVTKGTEEKIEAMKNEEFEENNDYSYFEDDEVLLGRVL
jgi:hypothetical protein